MKKLFTILSLTAVFVMLTAFDGPKDGRTIMEKMRDNVPLVAPIPGDYTGTFNGSVGNTTPGSGVFTSLQTSNNIICGDEVLAVNFTASYGVTAGKVLTIDVIIIVKAILVAVQ